MNTKFVEIWKPAKNFPLYEVSNCGNIRHINRKNIILTHRKNNRGYHLIDLYKKDKNEIITSHSILIHRIVAETFIKDNNINPDGTIMKSEKHQVNHKDGNKDNNSVNNLEWCDQSYNMKEAYKLGLRKYVPHNISDEYREKMRKLSSKPAPGKEIKMINIKDDSIIEIFESAAAVSKKYPEFKACGIRDAANHRRGIKYYKGYKWEFTGKITNGNKVRTSKLKR